MRVMSKWIANVAQGGYKKRAEGFEGRVEWALFEIRCFIMSVEIE